jgi:hypothetical protein
LFTLAVKAKLIPALSVLEFPKLKEPPAREDYFTQEQYNAVTENLPEYLRPVFAVGYYLRDARRRDTQPDVEAH